MARRIGIIYCQRIQDTSCVGCAKCYKAANEKTFEFESVEDDVQVVFKTGCGDCPGLVLPRLDLQKLVLDSLDTGFDAVYFGTCVKKAVALMNCPMNSREFRQRSRRSSACRSLSERTIPEILWKFEISAPSRVPGWSGMGGGGGPSRNRKINSPRSKAPIRSSGLGPRRG